LTTRLWRALPPVPSPPCRGGHVHAVLSDAEEPSLCFGEAEWRRKGQNVWCTQCKGGGAHDSSHHRPSDASTSA
jgi:hypothetical protein